jgi:hypothetical protein
MEVNRYRRAGKTATHQVELHIARTANIVWRRMRGARNTRVRPLTSREVVAAQAVERTQEIKEWLEEIHTRRARAREARGPRGRIARSLPRPPGDITLIKKWGELTWRKRWEKAIQKLPARRPAAVWRTPWKQDPRRLYAGLSKAEATALFLIRTEIIGLNAWLAAVQVPGIIPACQCGWHAQTVRHILMHCPRYERASLLEACGTERMDEILMRPECAKHAARWFVNMGILEQFRVAAEIAGEALEGYRVLPEAGEW